MRRLPLARPSGGWNRTAYPIVISDIYLDERTGLDVLAAARARNPKCRVILMTARGTMETVMAATTGGAFDYIAKPFELDTLLGAVKRAEEQPQPEPTGRTKPTSTTCPSRR